MIATVSSKYQVVIPKEIRGNIKPGTKLSFIQMGKGVFQVVPLGDISELKGMCPNLDTTIIREPDREL